MNTANELLVQMSNLLLEVMAADGVTTVTLNKVTNSAVEGTANDLHVSLSRMYDNNDHHLKLWWDGSPGKNSFIHHELSVLKSELHLQYDIEQEPVRYRKLQMMQAELAAAAAARPVIEDSDDDWI